MGLCKCPKRKVTNQFCYEHRVNVCEHCMVTNHPKCIIQSYLQWLQDSDYDPTCSLCYRDLRQDNEECLRLVCYHVFHWACLNKFALQLPTTTAPAGFKCPFPTCKMGVFPQPNLVSPVADVVRERLAVVNWARAGLGLPLLLEDESDKIKNNPENKTLSKSVEGISNNQRPHTPDQNMVSDSKFEHNHIGPSGDARDITPHSVVNVDDPVSTFSRTEGFAVSGQAPRRIIEALDHSRDTLVDHDEDKYKRRSALEWFSRWWKSMMGPSPRRRMTGGHLYRRYWMAAIIIVIGVLTLIVVFSWLGQMATENDPNLDPLQNPRIQVNNPN